MFLTMRQNNSGGYYITNDDLGVGENIIIECDDIIDAEVRFKRIAKNYGNGFYDFCSCCGKRWSDFEWKDESDLTEYPESWSDNAYIHYKSGNIEYKGIK